MFDNQITSETVDIYGVAVIPLEVILELELGKSCTSLYRTSNPATPDKYVIIKYDGERYLPLYLNDKFVFAETIYYFDGLENAINYWKVYRSTQI